MSRIKWVILIMVFIEACVFLPSPEFKVMGAEESLLQEIEKLAEDKLYQEVIHRCEEFKERFPKSKHYDLVLLRWGEALEELLEREYHQPVKNGVAEEEARKVFLDRYGHYQCWLEKLEGIAYDLRHYKMMMDRFPESNYADEAAYHLIPWVEDYQGLPEGPLKEIGYLEKILRDYPSTSLRPKLYYQIAYRLEILYEIYAFSPRLELRNPEEAKRCHEKAYYFYRLALQQSTDSYSTRGAWEGIKNLEEGKRIYLRE